MRVRQLTQWTNYDDLLGLPGLSSATPLGSTFSTDSLGPRQIPTLAPTEAAIRALSGVAGFRLTAGNLASTADSRIVTSPLVVEYGLTDRLVVGLVGSLV